MKSTFSTCVLASLLLSGCAKQANVPPPLAPKAYGTQIVEQSGGKQAAGVGAKLKDPVVVQVNGADGNAVAGALVSFHGDGLSFTPSQALTDDSGQVSTVAQLGTIPGSYVIVAETSKSGGGIFSLNLREIALGYQEKVGKQISDKYCIMCHDPESTPERVSNFDNLAPPPSHLFSDGSVLNAMSDADLIKIIADGGPALGKSPQTPAYRGTLTPGEIKAVVAYIRAIADPPYPHSPGPITDHRGCRYWNATMEDEPNWLSGALLVPREGACSLAHAGEPIEAIAKHFGGSVQLCRWRIYQAGTHHQLPRAPCAVFARGAFGL